MSSVATALERFEENIPESNWSASIPFVTEKKMFSNTVFFLNYLRGWEIVGNYCTSHKVTVLIFDLNSAKLTKSHLTKPNLSEPNLTNFIPLFYSQTLPDRWV